MQLTGITFAVINWFVRSIVATFAHAIVQFTVGETLSVKASVHFSVKSDVWRAWIVGTTVTKIKSML